MVTKNFDSVLLEEATETDELDVKSNFSVFEHYLLLTSKPLIAYHKTANLMPKLRVTGAL